MSCDAEQGPKGPAAANVVVIRAAANRAPARAPPRSQRSQITTRGRSMGSNRKKKTTFAKLDREQKLRDRRIEKLARKEARRLTVAPLPRDGADEAA